MVQDKLPLHERIWAEKERPAPAREPPPPPPAPTPEPEPAPVSQGNPPPEPLPKHAYIVNGLGQKRHLETGPPGFTWAYDPENPTDRYEISNQFLNRVGVKYE